MKLIEKIDKEMKQKKPFANDGQRTAQQTTDDNNNIPQKSSNDNKKETKKLIKQQIEAIDTEQDTIDIIENLTPIFEQMKALDTLRRDAYLEDIKKRFKFTGDMIKTIKKTYFYVSTEEQEEEIETFSNEIISKARALLRQPNLLGKFIEDTSSVYIGREKERRLLKLITVTRKIANSTKGIGCIVTANSSVGKSELVKTILATMDKADSAEYTKITSNNLLYRRKPLNAKVLTVYELNGSDLSYMNIRTALSEGRLSVAGVEKDTQGNLEDKEHSIDAKGLVFLSTTTKTKIDQELLTRIVAINLEHSERLARAVYKQKAKIANGEINNNDKLAVWRAADRLLKPQEVVIPFVSILAEQFPTDESRFMRDYDKIIMLIKASAILHQYQRDKDNKGKLIATLDDYTAVCELQNLLFEFKFDERLNEFMRIIKQSGGAITKGELANISKLDKDTLNRRIRQLKANGYVEVEGRGKKAKIILIDFEDNKKLNPLPKPEEIEKFLYNPSCTNAPNYENQYTDAEKTVQTQNAPNAPMHQTVNKDIENGANSANSAKRTCTKKSPLRQQKHHLVQRCTGIYRKKF